MGRGAILRESCQQPLTVRWPPAFAWGHVGGALLIGAVVGIFFDWKAVWVFGSSMAGGALVSALVCWWWPGFAGSWWKLLLVGLAANPLFLGAVVWMWIDRECLLGHVRGWNCLLSDVGPDIAAACLPTPFLGLVARWGWRRLRRT